MTGQLEGPGIARRLERLIRRVDDLERRLRSQPTAQRPDAEVGNELLLGDAGQDQIHGFTEDGDGYIHFNGPGEWDNGYFYQSTSGTAGTDRHAEVVLATSTYGNFAPEIRMRGDSEDGTTAPAHVSIDTKNGKLDILGGGGAYIFNRNIPVMRGAGSLSVSTTKFYIQCDSTVVTTNANGDATISFPSAFPTAVVSLVTSNGDQSPISGIITIVSRTTSGFNIKVRNHDNTIYGSQAFRCEWIAVGY